MTESLPSISEWPVDLSSFERPEASASISSIVDFGKSGSKPLHVIATNSRAYWVKTPYNPHGQESLLAEAICYATAEFLGASTPSWAYLTVPEELAKQQTLHNAEPIYPGIGFASEIVHEVYESDELDFIDRDDNPKNGPRFIALWELCDGGDEQFLYKVTDDYSIRPFDYGLWLGIGPQVPPGALPDLSPTVSRWKGVVKEMSALAFVEVSEKLTSMRIVDALHISAQVPVEWGFTDQDLILLARWIHSRKDDVARSLMLHAAKAGRE